jgi:hypothetical protein
MSPNDPENDRLAHLKRSRAAFKAHLTKKQRELSLLLNNCDHIDIVKEKLADVVVCWDKFCDAHRMVVQHLTDDTEIDEAAIYLQTESELFDDIQLRADKWIETVQYNADDGLDSASHVGSRMSRASNTSSAMRQKLVEEAANRKALEVKFMLLEEQQVIIERRMQLQRKREEEEFKIKQEERMLEIKAELAQAKAREQVYASAVDTDVQSATGSLIKKGAARKEEMLREQPKIPMYDLPVSDLNPNAHEWIEKHYTYTQSSDPPLTTEKGIMRIIEQQTKCLERLSLHQEQSVQSLTLPKPDMPVFNGDPMEYTTFIRAFQNMIEEKTTSNSTRLHFLVQYTEGDVRELMRSCLAMNPEDGYIEARALLKKRYGQAYRIASSYVDKITKGPTIKSEDGNALHKFSVLLTSCNNTLNNIGYMSKVENPDNLRAVITRLPFELRRKWRNLVDKINEHDERDIVFQDIVDFVEREARTVSHPIFGDIACAKDYTEKKFNHNNKSTRRTAYIIQADSTTSHREAVWKPSDANRYYGEAVKKQTQENSSSVVTNSKPYSVFTRSCVLCSRAEHTLEDCIKFKDMSMSSRVEFVRNKGLCFNCLIPRHISRDCRRWSRCTLCSKKHCTLLHPPNNETSPSVPKGLSKSVNASVVGAVDASPASNIGLPIVPVRVTAKGGKTHVVTYAFLDSGSNTTFCSDALIDQLGITGKKVKFLLTTLQNENKDTESNVVSLQVQHLDETNFAELPMVFSRPKLPVSFDDIPKQEDVRRWSYLDGIRIPRLDAQVDLLIGNDNPKLLEPIEVRNSRNGGPYAVKTLLGWAINGPLGRGGSNVRRTSNFIKSDVKLDQQFREFCNFEFNDRLVLTYKQMSQDDMKAVRLMDESVRFTDGHYELALPFKNSPLCLQDNMLLAEHRLQLLKKRFIRDPELCQKYSQFMTDLLNKGYAEEVPLYQINQPVVWYLPHHPVFNPQKPNKTRVVFDCSAKYKNISLNTELLQGPDMTNTLVGVLLRFRQEPVALIADIEAMFHQVRVQPKCRDVLRFLWWPDANLDLEPKIYRMNVHLFGAVSSPSVCNYALKKTADDNESEFDADTISTVRRNFYVDDCLKSTKDETTAVKLVGQLSQLLYKGGFHLTKWISNSDTVLEAVPVNERSVSCQTFDIDSSQIERALGVQWEIHSDKFKFKISIRERPATRRGILSVMSSIYDPLGFVSPLILPIKLILQDLCRKGIGWDDSIPTEYVDKWKAWLFELPRLEEFSIDRCLKPIGLGKLVKSELHYFSDASEFAYGAVAYLRLVDYVGNIHCRFVMGKSRTAPLKVMTIPRLELSAATVSIRLSKIMETELELPITRCVFWTDSTAVLKYIQNEDKRFNTFVANRIAVIHDGSSKDTWKYVDSKSNPADDASRGITVDSIIRGTRWSTGPGFLWNPEDNWPVLPVHIDATSTDNLEVKKSSVLMITSEQPTITMNEIFEKFSSWYKLKKFVCWMLRYKSYLRAKKNKDNTWSPITVAEMRMAEIEIFKYLQRQHFPEELKCLRKDEQHPENTKAVRKSSSLFRLDPILINDVLRVGGRLKRSTLPEDAKHQFILPKDHHITSLIIRHFHQISGHSGREYVLSLLRSRYWIVHANRTVRKILSSCVDCRKRQSAPGEQKMSDLPKDRVSPGKPPFSYVGVDFFGPLYVKRGRCLVKRYGCIFTCLTIRAIHIEITHSLDTSSFLNCLRRFIARRGRPTEIRSDNGGNLVSGAKEIRQCISNWNQDRIHDSLLQDNIMWIFNPPTGSHHGGVWERCIRTVRKIMMALISQQTLDDEGLSTLMCEVESIVNGRPITTVSSDPRDAEPLTPNHLLLLRSSVELPMDHFVKADLYARKRWRQIQYMADQFWRRWTREYLPSLQQRSKWVTHRRNFAVGDIVLVVDDQSPRNAWPLARVIEVYPGSDGLIRRLKVKTSTTVLERPIDKCILLNSVHNVESI